MGGSSVSQQALGSLAVGWEGDTYELPACLALLWKSMRRHAAPDRLLHVTGLDSMLGVGLFSGSQALG